MGFRGRLEITDGTTFIDLLGNASHSTFSLLEWEPSAPAPKGGGIWMDNPLLDGRQLAIRKESNIIDAFTIVAKGQTAKDIFDAIADLRVILAKAVNYWTQPYQYSSPVYLLIQYPEETQPTWAIIYDYRMSNLANPFTQPLYQSKKAVIPEFTLTIERSYRFSITGAACAEMNFSWKLTSIVKHQEFFGSADSDDIGANITVSSVFGGSTQLIGMSFNEEFEFGMRFLNITLNALDVIRKAYFVGVSAINRSTLPPAFIAEGEANVNPLTFSNWADYIGRVRTTTVKQFARSDVDQVWTQFDVKNIGNNGGLEDIIEEILALPGWASGNPMAFFLGAPNPSQPFDYRTIYTLDHATQPPPKLVIDSESVFPEIDILDSVCTGAIIANKDPFNSIGSVKYYDDSLAAFTTLSGTPLPWNLFPNPPAVNDLLYIACNYVDLDPQDETFNSIVFNLTQVMDNVVLDWEYWNGAAWTSIATADISDDTQSLRRLGQHSVAWIPASNWARTAVDGVTAFWVRARVDTIIGVSTMPIQGGTTLYAAGRPYIDVGNVQTGDIPTRMKLSIEPVGAASDNAYSIDEAFIASRSSNRGENFTPYLNLTSFENALPDGIFLTNIIGTFAQLNTSPTGEALQYAPAGVVAETDFFRVAFYAPVVSEYSGKFRIFLRRSDTTDPENLSYRLMISGSVAGPSSGYLQSALIADTTNPGYSLIDFGVFDLTVLLKQYKELFITVSGAASGVASVYWTDLIMFPVDEMFIRAYQRLGTDVTDWIVGYIGRNLVVDSITPGRDSTYIEEAGDPIAPLLYEANNDLRIYNRIDNGMRLWFLFGTYLSTCVNFQRVYHPGMIANVRLRLLPEYV